MPTNFTTYQQITDYMTDKKVYKLTGKDSQILYEVNPKDVGDNMVGFLSQIGWTGDNPNADTTITRIAMQKIYVDVDTNGGNGGEDFIWEVALNSGQNILHSKVNHREPVCDKVIEFLEN